MHIFYQYIISFTALDRCQDSCAGSVLYNTWREREGGYLVIHNGPSRTARHALFVDSVELGVAL